MYEKAPFLEEAPQGQALDPLAPMEFVDFTPDGVWARCINPATGTRMYVPVPIYCEFIDSQVRPEELSQV